MIGTIVKGMFLVYATVLTPCATEDSTNCVWDSAVQGNGSGTSFVAIDNGTVEYLIYADGNVWILPHVPEQGEALSDLSELVVVEISDSPIALVAD